MQFRFRDDSGDLNQFVDILRSLGLVAENVPQKPFSQFRPPSVNSTSSEISVAPSTPTTSYLSSSQHTEFKVPLRPDSANSSTSRFDNHISTRPLSSMSISTFMLQSKPSVEPLNRAQSFLIHQMEREVTLFLMYCVISVADYYLATREAIFEFRSGLTQ